MAPAASNTGNGVEGEYGVGDYQLHGRAGEFSEIVEEAVALDLSSVDEDGCCCMSTREGCDETSVNGAQNPGSFDG